MAGMENGSTLDGCLRLGERSRDFLDYSSWYAQHGAWIPRFRDAYAGEDCFLMGNGPSLNRVDLDALKPFHLIGLNKIQLLLERTPLPLTFHAAINALVIRQAAEAFVRLPCPSFLSYVPAREVIPNRGNIHYVLTSCRQVPSFADLNDTPLWEGYTVTFAAMQLAFFMGFQNVYLIGVDHNFVTQGRPNEEQRLAGDDLNHFDPRYFAGQSWHLPDLAGSEMAYAMARFAFERTGRAILDATIGGKCQIFQKIPIAEAIVRCRPRAKQVIAQ